nr:ABC transporter ATP-binding protein [Eubacterium ramulus]
MHSLFEIQHLSYAYHTMQGETPALSDITFTVNSGDFVAIVGPSGCGKSTLLNLLAGMLTPESGTLLLNGTPLTSDSRRHIGYMLQQDYLLEWRSIWKNVLLGLEIRHELTEESRTYAKQLLEKYGLEKFSQSKPSQLSGGMRQRAALVRTLVLKPELLLLDEPFSALDYQTRLSVSNDIGSIIRKEKKTAILVTHDLAEAVSLADRVIILTARPGRIQRIVSVTFPTDLTPMKRRDYDDFKTYFNLIWKELHHETS